VSTASHNQEDEKNEGDCVFEENEPEAHTEKQLPILLVLFLMFHS